MARAFRTVLQSIVSPVISTSLYFVVFGAAIGSRITEIDGISYGAFIVPGLIMLSLLTQSISNASFADLLPEIRRHDLRGAVGAGLLPGDRHRLCRRGGDQVDHPRPDHPGHGRLFVPLHIQHPFWMLRSWC
jgi:ABC-2 type transport system permease protein